MLRVCSKLYSQWMREKQHKIKINSEFIGSQVVAVKQMAISTQLNEGVGYSFNDLAALDYFPVLVDYVQSKSEYCFGPSLGELED